MKVPTLLSLTALSASISTGVSAFNFGTDKIRGVSLGGWLVLEPFITPSLFQKANDPKVIDEWTFGQHYGDRANGMIAAHLDNFITTKSFDLIKAAGLNTVRIPIGYWAVPGIKNSSEPFPTGQYPYLKKAVNWAKERDLKVIIDLHGAPGSQNGFDNSGRKGPINWYKSDYDVKKTLAALKIIVGDFIDYQDTVISIESINEPAGFLTGGEGAKLEAVTTQYYYDSYGSIRYPAAPKDLTTSTVVMLSDAFKPYTYRKGFMQSPGWERVALDRHYYSVFSADEAKLTYEQRLQRTCQLRNEVAESSKNLWTVIAELSSVSSDCAASTTIMPNLAGSFYDGTHPDSKGKVGSCVGKTGAASSFSQEEKDFMRQHFEHQVAAGEAGSGFMYWTWKTEVASEWSYYAGLEGGWIPRGNPTERIFRDECVSPKRHLERLIH